MANGEAKVTLLLELKNRISGALGKAKSFVNDNVRDIKERIGSLKESHVKAFSAMKDEVPGFGRAVALLTNPYALVTAAVVGLGLAFASASAKAATFDSAMAKANVTAQESRPELRKTGNYILDQAANSEYKGAANAAPEAYNILLSSGMDKKTALAGVNPTLDAAKAGFTDLATVARAAANSMNSSGIKDTTRIYDILFATLNKGNAEFGDIANYLPKIIPAAKNVGLNMEQVAGSFAFLTAQGLKSEQAATGLENIFKVLGDPDKVTNFKNIGVAIYDNAGKIKPFKDIVTQLDGALQGLTDKQKGTVLSSLGLDMEAAGALSIMAQNAGELGKTIGFVTDSSGQFKAAIESAKTPLDSWNKIGNKIDVAFIKVGQHLNEALGDLGNYLLDIGEGALPYINKYLDLINPAWQFMKSIIVGINNYLVDVKNTLVLLIQPFVDLINNSEMFSDIISLINYNFKLLKISVDVIFNTIHNSFEILSIFIKYIYDNTLKPFVTAFDNLYSTAKLLLGLKTPKVVQVKQEVKSTTTTTPDNVKDLKTKPNGQVSKVLADEEKKQKGKENSGTAIKGAEQVRNITTNVGNVINGDFITKNEQFSNMSPADFQRFLIDTLTRFTKGQELGLNG